MEEGTLKIVMCAMLKPFTRCVLTVGHYYGFFNISCPLVFGSRERRHVGNNVSLFDTLFNPVTGHIRIGDNCMEVTGRHYDRGNGGILTRAVPTEGYDVIIGRNCWIASGALIYGRASIGDGTIIGAGSVVTGAIPPGVLVAGNPAGIIHQVNGVYVRSEMGGPSARADGAS